MGSMYSTTAKAPYAMIDDAGEHNQYINSFCVTKRGTWLISVTIGHSKWGSTYTRRSTDRGKTWEDRVWVIEPGVLGPGKTVEMGQLLTVPDPIGGKERIYQFHIQHTHLDTRFGKVRYTVSHDDGKTWEGPAGPGSMYELPTPTYELSPNDDGWHLMAPGLLLDSGEWLLPLNISTDPLPLAEIRSELVFATSKNILTAKDPKDITFEFFPKPPHGVVVPLESTPGASLGQEPQVVQLSDRRLFCVCRTGNGCLWYTVSDDLGCTWREAQPLRYHDGGEKMLHPNCPCPITKLSNGRYVQLFCNNDGNAFGADNPFDNLRNRQPVYVSVGVETGSKTGQPLRFSQPRLLCTIEGFRPEVGWRDLTYGYFLEDKGDQPGSGGISDPARTSGPAQTSSYYHFYNAVWKNVQVNRVDPKLVEWDGK